MISPIRFREERFVEALTVIDRSGVVTLIESAYEQHRLPGGRTPDGIVYTVKAALVAALLRIIECTPPTYAGVLATLAAFDSRHLDAVGMGGQDMTALRVDNAAEYRRFHAWLDRRLEPLDPGADLPARRVLNDDDVRARDGRSDAERERSERASQRIRTVMNNLVAASVHDQSPPGFHGDLVADESIFDLAGHSAGLGSRPDKHRAAAYCGRYYVRDRKTGEVRETGRPRDIKKAAFGIGLTAVTRVGPPYALHRVAPVIVGIAVHPPTSGSTEGLKDALDGMLAGNLGGTRTDRTRWPYLTVDMGYNPKRGFADLMLDYRYAAVARYPRHWNLVFASADPRVDPGEESETVADEATPHTVEADPRPALAADPGPIQIAGAFYCPAVPDLSKMHNTQPTRELLDTKDFGLRDARLRRILPFLMGVNSRPYRALPTQGRPGAAGPATKSVKIELVCPAAMRRVRCSLKPDSMTELPAGMPTVTPEWSAHERTCCSKSSVSVTLTGDQLRLAQWGLVPGSWEHTLYFEAARSLTEQRFSLLKSPHLTGIEHLKWGPRREPMVKIILALAVAATNLRIQAAFDRSEEPIDSMWVRWRQLAADLGHEPVRTPPRT